MNNLVDIWGGAQTDFARNWTREGKNVIALLKEVMEDALQETGLTFGDIKKLNEENRVACFVGNFIAEEYVNQGHLGALLTEVNPAFNGVPSGRYEAACASSSVALDAAASKIALGEYDLAIVVGWELMKTVSSKECGDILGRAAYYEKEAKNVDFPFPKLFEKLAIETIRKYNLDEERYMKSLARISANNYENAGRNPLAQTRSWFMDYEQAMSRDSETNRLVGERLAVTDCSQVTDGACVVVLASRKLTLEYGKNMDSVATLKGYGHRTAPMLFEKKMEESKDDKYILPWTRRAVLDAYRRSELTVEDIDVFETHDCFTSSEYVAISAFGITEPGKEMEAVEDGTISFYGKKPINPSGGLIGCGHPVGASGCRMFLDLYRQVCGKAGDYQVKKEDGSIPKNGLMLNIGGTATTNYVFVVGKAC